MKGGKVIIVILLIAIFGAATLVVSMQITKRRLARDETRIRDIALIASGLQEYFATTGLYPPGIGGGELAAFIDPLPRDPLGGVYPYEQASGGFSYYLGANLESERHVALLTDADSEGTGVEGNDADGCGNEAGRYCYDVKR